MSYSVDPLSVSTETIKIEPNLLLTMVEDVPTVMLRPCQLADKERRETYPDGD